MDGNTHLHPSNLKSDWFASFNTRQTSLRFTNSEGSRVGCAECGRRCGTGCPLTLLCVGVGAGVVERIGTFSGQLS